MRFRSFLAVIAAFTVALSASAAPALAAKRKVPFGFMGAVLDPLPASTIPTTQLNGQMALMARSGVESLRTNISWAAIQPAPGVYDWAASDRLVIAAASHGLSLLPIVEFTPTWAAPSQFATNYPQFHLPSDPSTFGTFMTALVDRYGPHGSLWDFYPRLRRYAVRDWQIWNEPAGNYDWQPRPWPQSYTKLLKVGYRAVHAADPGAKVVSGAVVGLNTSGYYQSPWGEARAMYQAGAGRYFDVLAVNAYTNASTAQGAAHNSIKIVKYVRNVMKHHGDAHKPIWVTELTWNAALHQIPPKDYQGFAVSPKAQAARLTAYYEDLAKDRAVGVQRAFWYTWASTYSLKNTADEQPNFAFAGLVKWHPGSGFSPLPILSTYRGVSRKLEGCRKTSNAERCAG